MLSAGTDNYDGILGWVGTIINIIKLIRVKIIVKILFFFVLEIDNKNGYS